MPSNKSHKHILAGNTATEKTISVRNSHVRATSKRKAHERSAHKRRPATKVGSVDRSKKLSADSMLLEHQLAVKKPRRRAPGKSQSKVFRFMDLPGEMRNQVYEACASTKDIETHILTGRMPALALILANQQISLEYLTVYYSSKFMDVRVHDPATGTIIKIRDPLVLQCLLGQWPVIDEAPSVFRSKAEINDMIGLKPAVSFDGYNSWICRSGGLQGIFRPAGAGNRRWRHCKCWPSATADYKSDKKAFNIILAIHRKEQAMHRKFFVRNSPSWEGDMSMELLEEVNSIGRSDR